MKHTAIRSLLLCALSLFLTTSVVRCAEKNLIPQALFEDPKALDPWTIQQLPGTSVRLDSSVGRSGKSSVSIETFSGNEKDW